MENGNAGDKRVDWEDMGKWARGDQKKWGGAARWGGGRNQISAREALMIPCALGR